MEQSRTSLTRTVLVVLLVLAAFVVGYQLPRPVRADVSLRPVWAALGINDTLPATLDSTASLKPVQLFQEALSNLQTNYITPISDDQRQELVYYAIRGMLASLPNDPYTRFMDPKEFKDFNSDNAGHFAGIGATLNMVEIPTVTPAPGAGTAEPIICPVCGTDLSQPRHFRVAIVDTLPNSPAQAAGLLAGDFILKVDDTNTDGLLVSEVADKIRGPDGSTVTVTVARKGLGKPLDVKVVRSEINVPSVQHKVLDGGIGYMRILQFGSNTSDEVKDALADLKKSNVTGLLIDLRNNPGGLLDQCVGIASQLLPPDDKMIVTSQGRNGVHDDRTRVGGNDYFSQPIVVLVNRGSASASEILSGALKDYKRAPIVGERTYGKGLVQTVLQMGDRAAPSAIVITTAAYRTPNGFDVQKKGITPDDVVPLDAGTKVTSEKDNQAQAALKLLKDAIAKGN